MSEEKKSILEQIVNSEEVNNILSENIDLINETTENVQEFSKILKSFVLHNPKEFIGENLDETFKNVRVFAEVATAQYITEKTNMISEEIAVVENKKPSIDDYL